MEDDEERRSGGLGKSPETLNLEVLLERSRD